MTSWNLWGTLQKHYIHCCPFTYAVLVQLDLDPFVFLLLPSLLSRSIHCLPLSRTLHIYIQAQPWRTPGNCGPLCPLFFCMRRATVALTHTHTLSLSLAPFHDCLPTNSPCFHPRQRQSLAAARITTRVHRPPFSRSARSHPQERGSGFLSYSRLRTLARTSRLPLRTYPSFSPLFLSLIIDQLSLLSKCQIGRKS